MQLTHYRHSCLLVQQDKARLLIDPGSLSVGFEDLVDLDAILISHAADDHADFGRLARLITANPQAALLAGPQGAKVLTEQGLAATRVDPGQSLNLGGAAVQVVGGQHAVIHPDLPTPENIGFVIGGNALYYPGDSFDVPDGQVDVLAFPAAGPWLTVAYAADFVRAVHPRVAVPVHEATLVDPALHYSIVERLKPAGTALVILEPGRATRP